MDSLIASSRTWAEINLKALENNVKILRKQISNNTKFLGVVKANAYGHGSVQIAKKLQECKVDMLGVACIEEAIELRKGGIIIPILVLGITPPELTEVISEYEITQTIEDFEYGKKLSEKVEKLQKKIKVHIKIDTGMGRLGFYLPEDGKDEKTKKMIINEIQQINKLPGLIIEGIFTHFAKATDKEFSYNQIKKFKEIKENLSNIGIKFNITHAASSTAILNYPEAHFDMCRFGLVLYGYESTETGNKNSKLNLQPVMTVKSRISAIKDLPKDYTISYDCTYILKKDSKIAILPIGYGDGYPRNLSNKVNVKINGIICPVIGRICMDMIMVDVSEINDIKVGDIGVVYDEELITEGAEKTGTIIHELLSEILPRVKRVFIN